MDRNGARSVYRGVSTSSAEKPHLGL